MPVLWMMAGPNGAGKSTILARVNRHGLVVVSPDSISHETGLSRVSAGREALDLRRELFQSGVSHVVDTTFSGRGDFLGFVRLDLKTRTPPLEVLRKNISDERKQEEHPP